MVFALLYRSCAMEKLGGLAVAIEDAKEAIRLSPHMALGYFQLANLLWKQGDTRKTLLVFHKAMKDIPSDDSLYKQLESSKHHFEEQLNKSVSISLPKLPYEVVDQILSHLCLPELLRCRLVCKAWNETISKWPKLWKNVDDAWLTSRRVPMLVGKPLQKVSLLAKTITMQRCAYCKHLKIIQFLASRN